jgi:hypothetical protein
MSLTFKQYSEFLETSLDEERLDEWPWSNPAEKQKAKMEKLRMLAKRGDLRAKKELGDMEHAEKIERMRGERDEQSKERRFQGARADAEAGERGSSRAYDQETGSMRSKMAPKWNAVTRKWETPGSDRWDSVPDRG